MAGIADKFVGAMFGAEGQGSQLRQQVENMRRQRQLDLERKDALEKQEAAVQLGDLDKRINDWRYMLKVTPTQREVLRFESNKRRSLLGMDELPDLPDVVGERHLEVMGIITRNAIDGKYYGTREQQLAQAKSDYTVFGGLPFSEFETRSYNTGVFGAVQSAETQAQIQAESQAQDSESGANAKGKRTPIPYDPLTDVTRVPDPDTDVRRIPDPLTDVRTVVDGVEYPPEGSGRLEQSAQQKIPTADEMFSQILAPYLHDRIDPNAIKYSEMLKTKEGLVGLSRFQEGRVYVEGRARFLGVDENLPYDEKAQAVYDKLDEAEQRARDDKNAKLLASRLDSFVKQRQAGVPPETIANNEHDLLTSLGYDGTYDALLKSITSMPQLTPLQEFDKHMKLTKFTLQEQAQLFREWMQMRELVQKDAKMAADMGYKMAWEMINRGVPQDNPIFVEAMTAAARIMGQAAYEPPQVGASGTLSGKATIQEITRRSIAPEAMPTKDNRILGFKIAKAQSNDPIHYGTHTGRGVYDISENEIRRQGKTMEQAADELLGAGYVVAIRRVGQNKIESNHLHFANPQLNPKEANRLISQSNGQGRSSLPAGGVGGIPAQTVDQQKRTTIAANREARLAADDAENADTRDQAAKDYELTTSEKTKAKPLGFTNTAIDHGPNRIRMFLEDAGHKYFVWVKDEKTAQMKKTEKLKEAGKQRIKEINSTEAERHPGGAKFAVDYKSKVYSKIGNDSKKKELVESARANGYSWEEILPTL